MTAAQWKVNDSSITLGTALTRDAGTTYTLTPLTGSTVTLDSSDKYEGAKSLSIPSNAAGPVGLNLGGFSQANYNYLDFYFKTPGAKQMCYTHYWGYDFEGWVWVSITSGGALVIGSWWVGYGGQYYEFQSGVTGTVPFNTWCRMSIKWDSIGIPVLVEVHSGANIDAAVGTSATASCVGAHNGVAQAPYNDGIMFNQENGLSVLLDDIMIDSTAWPTRATSSTYTIGATPTSTSSVTAGADTLYAIGAAPTSTSSVTTGAEVVGAPSAARFGSGMIVAY